MFRHFTGLTMLRERPFDIYAGQEDVFGPGYFFSRHNPVFLLACCQGSKPVLESFGDIQCVFLEDNRRHCIFL